MLLPMAELLGERVLEALSDEQTALVADQRIERIEGTSHWFSLV